MTRCNPFALCPFRVYAVLALLVFVQPGLGDDDLASILEETSAELSTTTYQLQYNFEPGEMIVYDVVHQATVDTKIAGNRQVTKSRSSSAKAWKVLSVEDGNIRFEHMIKSVDMYQQVDGRDEITYDSEKDSEPPVEYEHVAKSIGKTLATVTINRNGQVIARESSSRSPDLGFGGLVVPLPKGEVKLGHTWAVPKKLKLRERDGRVKDVKTQMRYRLEKVKTGVATISVKTEVLTPITDATLKSQLVQQISNGEIRFDIDAGRVMSKQLDWTENVIGFNGPESNMKYLARFTEKLADNRTASKPKEVK